MFPVAIVAALAAKAVGDWLKHRGDAKAAQSQYDATKPYQQTANNQTAFKGALAGGISRAYGIDKLMAPGVLEGLARPIPVPDKSPGNAGWLQGLIGSTLSGAGSSYLSKPPFDKSAYEKAMGQPGMTAPATAAPAPAPDASILNGGGKLTRKHVPFQMFDEDLEQ